MRLDGEAERGRAESLHQGEAPFDAGLEIGHQRPHSIELCWPDVDVAVQLAAVLRPGNTGGREVIFVPARCIGQRRGFALQLRFIREQLRHVQHRILFADGNHPDRIAALFLGAQNRRGVLDIDGPGVGDPGNFASLRNFRYRVTRAWHKWLSRRSTKARIPWERFGELERRYPLPPARLRGARLVT